MSGVPECIRVLGGPRERGPGLKEVVGGFDRAGYGRPRGPAPLPHGPDSEARHEPEDESAKAADRNDFERKLAPAECLLEVRQLEDRRWGAIRSQGQAAYQSGRRHRPKRQPEHDGNTGHAIEWSTKAGGCRRGGGGHGRKST